jgi:hypothetical protein
MKKTTLVIILLTLAFILYGIGLSIKYPVRIPGNVIVLSTPTNFVEYGIVKFNLPDTQDVPHLVYEGSAGTSTRTLTFDELSSCAFQNGATPCIAMSVSPSQSLGDKRVLVEGIAQGETVLVRKIRVLVESEQSIAQQPGAHFISWPQAVLLIEDCAVSMVMQDHSLNVYLNLLDGRRVVAVEPQIDDVFEVVGHTQTKCGNIPIATE